MQPRKPSWFISVLFLLAKMLEHAYICKRCFLALLCLVCAYLLSDLWPADSCEVEGGLQSAVEAPMTDSQKKRPSLCHLVYMCYSEIYITTRKCQSVSKLIKAINLFYILVNKSERKRQSNPPLTYRKENEAMWFLLGVLLLVTYVTLIYLFITSPSLPRALDWYPSLILALSSSTNLLVTHSRCIIVLQVIGKNVV